MSKIARGMNEMLRQAGKPSRLTEKKHWMGNQPYHPIKNPRGYAIVNHFPALGYLYFIVPKEWTHAKILKRYGLEGSVMEDQYVRHNSFQVTERKWSSLESGTKRRFLVDVFDNR